MSAKPDEIPYEPACRSREQIREWLVRELSRSLGVAPATIDIHAPLYSLGADSLTAITLTGAFAQWLQRDLPATLMWDYESLEAIARALGDPENVAPPHGVVYLQPRGHRTPLFCFPGTRGHCVTFAPLAAHLGPDQPCYGLTVPVDESSREPPLDTIEELAAGMLRRIRLLQPKGPYQFAGYSFGGLVAFEAAQQLTRLGETVSTVALYDTYTPPAYVQRPRWQRVAIHAWLLASRSGRRQYVHRALDRRRRLREAEQARRLPGATDAEVHQKRVLELERVHIQAAGRYRPGSYPGALLLFRAAERTAEMPFFRIESSANGWATLAPGRVKVIEVPGTHQTLLAPEHACAAATLLQPHLLGANPQDR